MPVAGSESLGSASDGPTKQSDSLKGSRTTEKAMSELVGSLNSILEHAESLSQRGNFELALEYFDKALHLDSNSPRALANKAHAMFALGNVQEVSIVDVFYFNSA